MTQVKEVMTVPVVKLSEDTTLGEATTMMASMGISGAPVVDREDRLVGILCESDILEFAATKEGLDIKVPTLSFLSLPYDRLVRDAELCRRYQRVGETRVKDAMNEEVVTIGPDEDVRKALEAMVRFDFNRLPVVKDGKLVGMIARQDVLLALCRELAERPPPVCATVGR